MTAEDTFSVSCLIRLPRRCAHSQRQLAPLFMALKLRLPLTSILKVLYPGERHSNGVGQKERAGKKSQREREKQSEVECSVIILNVRRSGATRP